MNIPLEARIRVTETRALRVCSCQISVEWWVADDTWWSLDDYKNIAERIVYDVASLEPRGNEAFWLLLVGGRER